VAEALALQRMGAEALATKRAIGTETKNRADQLTEMRQSHRPLHVPLTLR